MNFVTGATGFVGSAVVRALLAEGREVRALVRDGADTRNLAGLDVEIVNGDITDAASVQRGVTGCDAVFHLAAMVHFWVPRRERFRFQEVNVCGTKNVLSAALDHSVDKVVYTSTVSTIGCHGIDNPTTEEHSFNLWKMSMEYEWSKYTAEFEAWRFAARGLPLVSVLPAAPLGARDIKPNPVGKLILDFLSRKLPGYIDGGGNFVDVDDVARGHVLALDKGRVGERYILGNENLSVIELFTALEEVSGIRAPRLKIPYAVALSLAHALEFVANRVTNLPPLLTPALTKFSSMYYYLDSSKAARELGWTPRTSVKQAAVKTIQWFLDHDYLQTSEKVKTQIGQRLAQTQNDVGTAKFPLRHPRVCCGETVSS